ncbi:MAG: hypothetical protein ABI480_04245 [Chitinophagaceae bacterium]
MFNLKNYDLSDINPDKNLLDVLFEIFRLTLNPSLTKREFMLYYFGQYPDSFDMTFIYKENNLAGFCTSAAYPRRVNGKKIVILRSAFGLLDTYKKGKFPLQGLFFKYMRYKLRHLFTPVYVAGFMANPLMYAMICKYTLKCYPRRNDNTPEKILAFKNDLLKSMNLDKKEVNPFVLKIHFQVKFKETDIDRFVKSTDKDVQYFLSINPGYNDQMGVLVLVPVTLPNMTYTFFRYLLRKVRLFFRHRKTK